mmetsp:Transcript_90285/g.201812  ORF Transcript_90285/g.201812 Transcript_90285/m.201812 type:complete len:207 (-) Transcript_90285:477-1097(-)
MCLSACKNASPSSSSSAAKRSRSSLSTLRFFSRRRSKSSPSRSSSRGSSRLYGSLNRSSNTQPAPSSALSTHALAGIMRQRPSSRSRSAASTFFSPTAMRGSTNDVRSCSTPSSARPPRTSPNGLLVSWRSRRAYGCCCGSWVPMGTSRGTRMALLCAIGSSTPSSSSFMLLRAISALSGTSGRLRQVPPKTPSRSATRSTFGYMA